MAQVDFSNAHIEPARSVMAANIRDVALNNVIADANGNQITSNSSRSLLTNESRELSYKYTGTFTASGTSLYLYANYAWWRIYNISFNSGDTYDFSIKASII